MQLSALILHECENLQLNVLLDKTLISDVLLNRPCKGKFAVLLELLFEVYWMVIWLCCKIGMCWCEKQRQVGTAVRCLLSLSSPPKWEVLRWEWSPPSSCSPSEPKQSGSSQLLWKQADRKGKHQGVERASSFGGLISHRAPHQFNCSFKSRAEAVNSNIGQERWEITMWKLMWWCERMELLFACCQGDIWCIVTSRGGDHGEDTLTVHLYIAIKNYTACFCVLIYLYKTWKHSSDQSAYCCFR